MDGLGLHLGLLQRGDGKGRVGKVSAPGKGVHAVGTIHPIAQQPVAQRRPSFSFRPRLGVSCTGQGTRLIALSLRDDPFFPNAGQQRQP